MCSRAVPGHNPLDIRPLCRVYDRAPPANGWRWRWRWNMATSLPTLSLRMLENLAVAGDRRTFGARAANVQEVSHHITTALSRSGKTSCFQRMDQACHRGH